MSKNKYKANEILQALGGRQFIKKSGSYNYHWDDEELILSFRLSPDAQHPVYFKTVYKKAPGEMITIKYRRSDLYTMSLLGPKTPICHEYKNYDDYQLVDYALTQVKNMDVYDVFSSDIGYFGLKPTFKKWTGIDIDL